MAKYYFYLFFILELEEQVGIDGDGLDVHPSKWERRLKQDSNYSHLNSDFIYFEYFANRI